MNSDAQLPAQPTRSLAALARLRRKVRSAFARDGGVTLLGLGLLAVTGSFLADYALVLPRGARGVLLAAGAIFLALGVWRRIVRPLRLELGDTELAILVEKAHPGLSQELLTAVELTRPGSESAAHVSPALIENVVRRVEEKVESIPFDQVLSLGRFRKKVAATGAGLALLAGLAATSPSLAALWASRNLFLSSSAWPRSTELRLVRPSTPIRVAVGDPLTLEVEAVRGAPASLVIQSVFPDRPLVADTVPETSSGFYQKTFENVSRPFRLRILGGDDELGPYEVEIHLRPRIDMSSLRLWCEFPASTGLAPTPENEPIRFGNLKVPVGTRVKYRLAANVPIVGAYFVLQGAPAPGVERPAGDGTPVPPATGASRGEAAPAPVEVWPDPAAVQLPIDPSGELSGSFEVKESGQYYFQLEARDGFRNRKPDRFRIEAILDQKPLVKVLDPERLTEEVTAVARLPVKVSASDDYRVVSARISGLYFAPAADRGVEQSRPLGRWGAPSATEGAAQTPPAPGVAPGAVAEDEILLPIESLVTGTGGPPVAGGRFQFWAEASDSAAQVGLSQEHTFQIVEKDDLLRVLTDQLMIVRDQLRDAVRKEKSARKDLEELQGQIALLDKLPEKDATKLFRHRQDQHRITQALEREVEELNRILVRTARNAVGDEAWRGWVSGVHDDVSLAARKGSPAIEQTIELLQREAPVNPVTAGRLGGVATAQRDLERDLENIVLRLSEFGDKNAQLQRLREIRRRLDDLRSETRVHVEGKTPGEPQK